MRILQVAIASFFWQRFVAATASIEVFFPVCKGKQTRLRQDTFSLFGVLDGHGPNGHEISQFVKDEFFRADNSEYQILQDLRLRVSYVLHGGQPFGKQ